MIKEFKQNKKEIEKINKNLDNLRDKNRKKGYKIKFNIYDKQIRKLTNERDNKISKLDKEFEKIEKQEMDKKDKLSIHINKVKRILEFIKINKEGVRKLDFKAYSHFSYQGKKNNLEPIDTIADDEFKKIQVFIYKNDKPINCYTLCVVGMTIFNKDILEIPYSYGLDIIKEGGHFSIGTGIKELSEEEKLKVYYNKNKDKILKEFLEEHKKAEEEYKEVLENYINKKEWIKLYIESRIYYYENHYSRGTETDEYKKFKKELESLK